MDKWRDSEFLESDEDPLGPMANLVDIILVFACGLIAALVSFSPDLQQHFSTERINKDIIKSPQCLSDCAADCSKSAFIKTAR